MDSIGIGRAAGWGVGGEAWPDGGCGGREAFPGHLFIIFDFATPVNKFSVHNGINEI